MVYRQYISHECRLKVVYCDKYHTHGFVVYSLVVVCSALWDICSNEPANHETLFSLFQSLSQWYLLQCIRISHYKYNVCQPLSFVTLMMNSGFAREKMLPFFNIESSVFAIVSSFKLPKTCPLRQKVRLKTVDFICWLYWSSLLWFFQSKVQKRLLSGASYWAEVVKKASRFSCWEGVLSRKIWEYWYMSQHFCMTV